ncbi:hypothetical protein [Spiroplasma diminutum]|uniref:Uncharacterized protein n=1 Tax=Spiroplasma diminutum CUAS-1 TaxID=1276221 RepID=S5MJ76_9MOLU|nr:hypothetical protein [Spiroplasma diminutum]AGR42015.1 hypothetical protein SDIMI_v3c03110 [Spiroplasma diminutum CUAS-1]
MKYIIIISGSLLLLAIVLTILLYSILKVKNQKKPLKKVTNEPFFINEEHNKEKWWVSKDGNFEKKWMEVQDYDFSIKYFNYEENFSKGFLNSKFIRTKIFLSDIMDIKSAKKTIEKLEFYSNCLENIWWNKYKILLTTSFNEIPKITQAPEYFFYKYYFKFISKLRNIMISYLTEYIIPNVIITELKQDKYKKFNINIANDPKSNILFAFEQVAQEADDYSEIIHEEFNKELKQKGPEWKIDYSTNKDPLSLFLPEEIIKKNMMRNKILNLSKKYNIPFKGNIQETVDKLEKHLNSVEQDKINSIKQLVITFKEQNNA